MKKFFLGFMAIILMLQVHAQNVPTWVIPGDYENGSFPLFWTNVDTIRGNAAVYGTDTNRAHLHRGYYSSVLNNLQSVTFTNNFYLAGIVTPTVSPVMQVTLYGSANNGFTWNWNTPITTFTVSPVTSYSTAAINATVPTTETFLVNPNFGGNPWTDYMWVVNGHVTDTVQWTSSVLVR